MTDTLEVLRKMTEELPPIPKLGDLKASAFVKEKKDYEEYEIGGGVCRSYSLFSSPKISVARTSIPKGTEFPLHVHNETEYGLIYSGSGIFRSGHEEERELKIGDTIVIEPNIPHWFKASEDTWFIVITIPYSKDFPDGRNE